MSEKVLRPMLSEARKTKMSSTYSIIGSHSAVKLCRWQKSMLRGRGGCYKWTMYGIASHRCIEVTPCMACANNCIFCWRHNSNPNTTSWKWECDSPEYILHNMLKQHRTLINEIRTIPGVRDKELKEALNPCHCALSLVGEPIIYPNINQFIKLLHEKHISSFLVNNGQFPEALRELTPVTQLYLSVDASNKEVMRELTRPVFPDFWERFSTCVRILDKRQERTVFRLTLIDGYNMNENEHIIEYIELISLGNPDFIELKRLTPAFSSDLRTKLRMKNVPSWPKMQSFAKVLCDALNNEHLSYFIASIHEHSGCILLAKQKFCINGVIHTWINFEQFFHLVENEHSTESWQSTDYLLATPDWALPTSKLEGFDPSQKRHITGKRKKYLERNDVNQSSGCDNEIRQIAGQ